MIIHKIMKSYYFVIYLIYIVKLFYKKIVKI